MTYFYRNGRKINLQTSKKFFVLHCGDIGEDEVLRVVERSGIKVIVVREALVLVETLEGQTEIERVLIGARLPINMFSTYFVENQHDFLAPTGRIAIRFPTHYGEEEKMAILQKYHLTCQSSIKGMPNGYTFNTLKDPIEVARALVEDDGMPEAEPDFIVKLIPRSWFKPSDVEGAGEGEGEGEGEGDGDGAGAGT